MDNAPQTLGASALFPNVDILDCIECGQQMELRDGVAYHLSAGDVSGHDLDADHVAIAPEDESGVVTCARCGQDQVIVDDDLTCCSCGRQLPAPVRQ